MNKRTANERIWSGLFQKGLDFYRGEFVVEFTSEFCELLELGLMQFGLVLSDAVLDVFPTFGQNEVNQFGQAISGRFDRDLRPTAGANAAVEGSEPGVLAYGHALNGAAEDLSGFGETPFLTPAAMAALGTAGSRAAQLPKCFQLFHRLMSWPISARSMVALEAFKHGRRVRSLP